MKSIYEFIVNNKLRQSKQLNVYHLLRSDRYYVEVPDVDTYKKLCNQIMGNDEGIYGGVIEFLNDTNKNRAVLLRPAIRSSNKPFIGTLTPEYRVLNDIYKAEKMEPISISNVNIDYWKKQNWKL